MNQNNPTELTEPDAGDPDAVRADIDRTRAELADTVDQLADKLNVRAQASQKAGAARDRISETAARAKASAPPQVQHVLDRAAEKVAPVAHQVSSRAVPHRGKIIAGMLAAIIVLRVMRRRRGRGES